MHLSRPTKAVEGACVVVAAEVEATVADTTSSNLKTPKNGAIVALSKTCE